MTTGWGQRNAAVRLAAALLAGCGALALTACEQRAEPRPAYEAAPPPPPAPLAGEPEAAPSAAPSQAMPPPGPETAPSLAPSDPAPPRDEGLVAMAPIPNPEDGGPAPYGAPPPHAARHVRTYAAPPHVVRRHRVHAHGPAPAAPRALAASAHVVPHPASTPSARPTHRPPSKPAAPPPPTAAKPVVKPVAAPHHERRATKTELRRTHVASNTTGASTTGANTTTGDATGADADSRTEALRSALSTAVARGAVLTAPRAARDGASEVTLTLPAGFYDTVKTEAGKQAMGEAAASANAEATLTGDGYAIIPGGPQAQPLRVGQPTLFRWTVTAPAGAKGPLRADVKVDLLGGGSQVLALGAVDPADAQGGGFRWWGAALLLAVVALGFWWLLRTRSADARIAASRKRARRPEGTINGQRPLDLRPHDDPPLR